MSRTRMPMNWIAVAATAVMFAATPAAADGPAYPAASAHHASSDRCGSGPFSGTYLGASMGMLWLDSTFMPDSGNTNSGSTHNGFTGGIFGGRNWQCGGHVYGFEADMGFGGTKTSVNYTNATATSTVDWYSTLRGRVGVTDDNFMVYLTGGLAMGTTEHTFTAAALGVSPKSDSAFGFGYTVGGGLEYARGPWGVRLEGLLVDLGTTNQGYGAANFNSTRWDDAFWTGRLGVSYKISD